MQIFPIVPPEHPDDGIVVGWLLFIPIMLFMLATIVPVWRRTHNPSLFRGVPIRSIYLAYFLAPSVVGLGGPTGAFLLPGPAFLMLTFGQWYLKGIFGVLPITVCFVLILPIYMVKVWVSR